jgi:hypothetical protein
MKTIYLPAAVIVLGIVFFLLSFLWPAVMGAGTVWSEEQAEEYAEAAADLHAMLHAEMHAEAGDAAGHEGHHGHGHAGAHERVTQETLDQAKERYAVAKSDLAGARAMRSGPARFFKWTGLVFFALGVVGYFVVRNAAG